MPKRKILILGASYGSLLGAKLALAGHAVRLVCLPAEAALINGQGVIVRLPVAGREAGVELRSRDAPGELDACGPAAADPGAHDLVGLAMQEPQFRAPEVRELLGRIARAGRPCLSIMNMPPLPYLRRLPGVDAGRCAGCYTDPTVWDGFDPGLVALCSPDPQAFRPPGEAVNVLQVRLASNFKAAPFAFPGHDALLRELAADVEAARLVHDGGPVELPVKLKAHDSVFVPLAKWAMLLAGNYRCVRDEAVVSIREAVHCDARASRAVYDWVRDLCVALGAREQDLVPFDKYAAAAQLLTAPSSAARALAGGAPHIERVDRLVQEIAAQKGLRNAAVDETVARVDAWLARNRARA